MLIIHYRYVMIQVLFVSIISGMLTIQNSILIL